MKIGVDYYPEQWEEALWEQDADQMQKIGVKLVRMAEFAWSRLEPEEGKFDFSWLDRAVSVFEERGIEVFLCTPTCTPPLWLFEKYPEVIQVGTDGRRIPIGIRGHRCLNSPVFRSLCKRIITEMVSHFKDNAAVVGYQIDNELEANHCRCEVCREGFRTWIEKKYHTTDALNQAYGNTVWSGEYSDFSQVEPPMGEHIKWQNPSLTLDYNRYASESTVDYVRFQADLIRNIDSRAVITTNNWLCENMPDFYEMFKELDFVSYDNYPTTDIPEDEEALYSHAFHLDLMRGIKRKNFWIMEQLSGSVGSWMPMSSTVKPGMLKGYALQAIAHGADAVLHFRWRTAVSGAEMYWHGILDHSNVPGRRYQEFAGLCQTVNALSDLEGSQVKNKVALLYGSDQEYAFKLQHQAENMYYLEQLKLLHDGFTSIGVGVDIVDENADICEYSVVLAPNLMITRQEIVDKLYRFVDRGGSLVLTCRCGVKDIYNKCIMQPLPTVYQNLIGAHVTEYDVIGDKRLGLQWNEEGSLPLIYATQWCDLLETDTAKSIVKYARDEKKTADKGVTVPFYAGDTAATCNAYGKGTAYYIGTVANRDFYKALATRLAGEQGLNFYPDLPRGVELTFRQKGEESWFFLFNNTDRVQNFELLERSWSLAPFAMEIRKW